MEGVLSLIFAFGLVLTGAQENGDLRLMGGDDAFTGRVEIYLDGEWGTIDAPSDSHQGVAQTVCWQFGYTTSYGYGTVSSLGYEPANESVPMALQNVKCKYNTLPGYARQHLLRCDYSDGPNDPDHQRDFAVKCLQNDITLSPYDTQVRLAAGETGFSSSGFVEVFAWSTWGPVCNMKVADADTACRQLGYTESVGLGSDDYDHFGSDKVDSFTCSSSQSCLRKCFDYGSSPFASCTSYSYINCTFNVENKNLYGTGDQSSCSTLSNIIAWAVGVVVGLFIFFCVVTLACIICWCCCIPGCLIRGTRRRVVYEAL